MAADPSDRIYELDQLANQPGTYFNPQTEVVLIVEPLRAGKWTDVKENYGKLTEEWGEFRNLVNGR